MATRAALEKRLAGVEAKSKPKMISTLADFVLFIANRQDGEEWPPLSPEMAELFGEDGFYGKKRGCHE